MPETITYRKSNDDVFWHINPKCPDWPIKNYNEVISEHAPTGGGFCTHCIHMRMLDIDKDWVSNHQELKCVKLRLLGVSRNESL